MHTESHKDSWVLLPNSWVFVAHVSMPMHACMQVVGIAHEFMPNSDNLQ
jgi:hypothetical protein